MLIESEDTANRAELKIARAVAEIHKLMVVPTTDADDELKRKQLMELALIKGSYGNGTTQQQTPTGGGSKHPSTNGGGGNGLR